MNLKRVTAVTVVTAVTALAAACGGSPDVAACKAAMRHDFVAGMTNPNATPATRPPACQGVDNKTIQRLAGEIIQEQLQKGP